MKLQLSLPSLQAGASLNPGGMTHFASQEMLQGSCRSTRCVLRPVDESKCVCGRGSAPDPAGEAYDALPDSFGEGE